MSHSHANHTSAARNPDGTINQETLLDHAEQAISRARANELSFPKAGQVDDVDTQGDIDAMVEAAKSLTPSQKLFWFVADAPPVQAADPLAGEPTDEPNGHAAD